MSDKQNLAEIARKKRYLHLVEKLHSGKALTKQEIKELEDFEAEPLDATVVKTIEEVARVMNVSYRTVQRWKKDGMPVGEDGYYDLEEIKAWHDEKEGITPASEGKFYWEERIRKCKAELLELELKKVTGELLPKDEVESGRAARILAVKRAFLALPTRMAPKLAMKESREIEVLLSEAIGEIIDEFAGVRKFEDDDVSNIERRPSDLESGGTIGVASPGEDRGQPMG
jgi:phage terminase Nu1 subunit (DNA packaging protein)